MSSKSRGFELWRKVFKGAKFVVAPMVDQSELPWRMLGRRDQKYRKENFVVCEEDRPLIVQFCANDPEVLLAAARYVAPYCDAVDINLGCPQSIAKKGHYGAFLQDEWELIGSMVSLLDKELSVPVTCKVRVFEDIAKTVEYAKMLEKAGCQLLTIHGRTREQRSSQTGLASWKHIKAVRQNVKIPVFANGNIQFLEDVQRCLSDTGVEGVMSAESHLHNPALFTGEHPPCWRVSEEYLSLVRQFPCAISAVRGHFFKIWLRVLKEPEYQCFRERLGTVKFVEDFEQISGELKTLLLAQLSDEELSAEFTQDDIPFWRCQPYVRPNRGIVTAARESGQQSAGEDEERVKRKKRAAESKAAQGPPKKKRWFTCDSCSGNPKGLKCVNNMCKTCCKQKCLAEGVGCRSHRFTPRPPDRSLGGDENTAPKMGPACLLTEDQGSCDVTSLSTGGTREVESEGRVSIESPGSALAEDVT